MTGVTVGDRPTGGGCFEATGLTGLISNGSMTVARHHCSPSPLWPKKQMYKSLAATKLKSTILMTDRPSGVSHFYFYVRCHDFRILRQ